VKVFKRSSFHFLRYEGSAFQREVLTFYIKVKFFYIRRPFVHFRINIGLRGKSIKKYGDTNAEMQLFHYEHAVEISSGKECYCLTKVGILTTHGHKKTRRNLRRAKLIIKKYE
jgi:hypothetical protein